MKKSIRFLSFFSMAALIMASQTGQAQVANIAQETPSLARGVRPLGMGNAFVAQPGTDENAIFYNPAAINDYEKKFHFRFLSPTVDISTGSLGLIGDVTDLADDIDATDDDSERTAIFRNFVNQHIGQFESAQTHLPLVTMMHKWVSLSLLADSRNTIAFRNRSYTSFDLSSRSDFGGIIGTAYNFKDLLGIEQNLQAGVNVKVLHRLSIDQIITLDDIINNADFDDVVPRNRATGVGVDLGIKADMPTFGQGWLETVKPTLALAWQDIGNTRFGNGVVDTEQSLTIGFALHPTIKNWQLHFTNDFRELTQSADFMKKWNIGAEAFAPQLWGFFTPSLRVGGHQGYITAGASLDFKYAKLEFATYGEEAGTRTSSKQLRRIATNLSFGF